MVSFTAASDTQPPHTPGEGPEPRSVLSGPTLAAGYARPVVRPNPGCESGAVAPRATPAAAVNYLRAKVMTATPEQLQLMLYDGAIRFAEQARVALVDGKFDESYNAFTRAQAIITELQCGLRPDHAPDLCRNLSALYNFVYLRLVEANISHDVKNVDEALQLLRYQRETWMLLMQETAKAKASHVAAGLNIPSDDAETIERLSIAG